MFLADVVQRARAGAAHTASIPVPGVQSKGAGVGGALEQLDDGNRKTQRRCKYYNMLCAFYYLD